MLFTPTRSYKSILQVTPDILEELGVTALILDIDNTMTTHDNPAPLEGLFEWLKIMNDSGIKMMIVSNNRSERVTPFAQLLKLEFVPRGAKPLPKGYKAAAKLLGVPKSEICTIGDQLFTDILGAKLFGIKSILVDPIEPEKTLFFRVKRTLEKPFRGK